MLYPPSVVRNRSLPLVATSRLQQLWQWSFQPLEYLDSCARRYGDCFVGRIGTQTIVFFSHPEAIAQLFAASSSLDVGRIQQSVRYSMGSSSTLLLDGEPHRKRRKLLMPPFHGERMRAYGQIMGQVAESVAQSWKPGRPLTMLTEMNRITLEIILQAVFGVTGGDRSELQQALQDFVQVATPPSSYLLGSLLANIPAQSKLFGFSRFWRQRQRIDQLIFAEIRARRIALDADRADILSLLLSAQDEDGQQLTQRELRDELMTMLLAGHDSSAASLAWGFYFIHTHPDVKAKLIAELESLGTHADPMTVVRLPYLSAVCSESLRLRSAAPTILHRVTNCPIRIQGYELPPNTWVSPCNYLTHHRADLYPSPHLFRPERFLEKQYSASEYYPFGGGDRYCIGAAFALFEMKLVLARILTTYDLTLIQNFPISAIRRGINIAPQGGVKMIARPRVPA
jgi:cytochrome P450 family 110